MTEQTPAPEPPDDAPPWRWVAYYLPGRTVINSTRRTSEEVMDRFAEVYAGDGVLWSTYADGSGSAFPARQVISMQTRLLKPHEKLGIPPTRL